MDSIGIRGDFVKTDEKDNINAKKRDVIEETAGRNKSVASSRDHNRENVKDYVESNPFPHTEENYSPGYDRDGL